jgi:aromatic-L-amino-acid decarboxylase
MSIGRHSRGSAAPAETMQKYPGTDVLALEPTRAVAEEWLALFGRFVLDHIDGLTTAPAGGIAPAQWQARAAEVATGIGDDPLPGGAAAIITLLDRAAEASLLAPGPGYLAYIPGGGLFGAALADLVADCLNRYTGMPAPAPALFRLEQDVLAWLCRSFGYGPEARAVLTPGGSAATLSAVVTARHQAFGDGGDFSRAVIYTSVQAHHSIAKAARLAGIPARLLRRVPVDRDFRMNPAALAAAIDADRAQGLRPFLIVAAGGTTNTGAVDPLPAIADLAARHQLWMHVDGAYGGAFVLTDAGRARLAGIERADSVAFDPHKGLFLPYGTGCLLARDGAALRQAHHLAAEYLQDLDDPQAEVSWSPADLGPDLSRDFRGLRLWLPLMLHGARAFREALDEKLALAERFTAGLDRLIAEGAPIEIVARPQLSLVAFRLARRRGEPLAAWNDRNRALLGAINGRQRVHLSSTLLDSEDGAAFTLRACVLSFRTHAAHIDQALADLAAAFRSVGVGGQAPPVDPPMPRP